MARPISYCSVEGCHKRVCGHALCDKHYRRWRKHGDPLVLGRPGPKNLRPAEERFWEKVDRRGPDDCWPWTGGGLSSEPGRNYGSFWFEGHNHGAHKFSLYLATGVMPSLFVCHRCDNPPCVNPAHLFEGTVVDNAQDMVAKGRWLNQHRYKTHCIHGHPLSGDNVRVDERGTRHCRECARRRNREYEERRSARH